MGVLLLSVLVLTAGFLLISGRWRYLINNQVAFATVFQIDSVGYMIRMFRDNGTLHCDPGNAAAFHASYDRRLSRRDGGIASPLRPAG